MQSKNFPSAKGLRQRILMDRMVSTIIFGFAMATLVPLILIICYLIQKGVPALNFEFFTQPPVPIGSEGGGVLNAIVGTVILVAIASIIAIPIGIGAGIYLAETRQNRTTRALKLATDILQSSPSIVVGVIAYIWLVKPFKQFSAISGSFALTILMIPMVIYSTEETLKLIPQTLKEASYALGVPYYKTMLKVVLPAGLNGILTGTLVGISRIAGETAPLLFTAFGNPSITIDPFKPVSALPLLIFNYSYSPYPEWWEIAWGASLLLTAMVLFFNLSAKVIAKKWKISF